MLSGLLTVSLAGRTYELAPGDAAHFDSRLPHRLIARGGGDVELLLVASPLALERRVSGQMFLPSSSKRAIPMLEISDHARQLLPPS